MVPETDVDYLTRNAVAAKLEEAVKHVLAVRPENPIEEAGLFLQRADGPATKSEPGSHSGSTALTALERENTNLRNTIESLKKTLIESKDENAALKMSATVGNSGSVDLSSTLFSICMDTDSYKLSHWLQYPPNTSNMFSYFESRGGQYPGTIFFGLQYFLKRFLHRRVTMPDVEQAAAFARKHLMPFNEVGWRTIVERHHGRLPIRIRSVPEGTWVPTSNILLSVESLDPESFWVVSWLETMLVRLWCPTTIATNSWELRRLIQTYLDETSDEGPDRDPSLKMHDFGARGVSSQETAMVAGAAHLISFGGSDTLAGVWCANEYYHDDMAAVSIPASEHSTMTMWGREHEVDAYRNMITAYGDGPIFACVSDSYDIFNAVENIWGGALKDEVLNMKANLVIRPDSGDPVEVCLRVAELLDKQFGSTTNTMGYKVINKVRIIQGDGVNAQTVKDLLIAFKNKGYSCVNIGFGSGGGLLQKFHRDTCKFAFKCSWAIVDGKEVEVFKDPVTDPGKKSKKGRLDLVRNANGDLETVVIEHGRDAAPGSVLETVYENGVLLKETTFSEVKQRAHASSQDAKRTNLPLYTRK